MPYKYSKIYNVTQSTWAHDVSGEDNAYKVWRDNEWNENDALVGFYSENGYSVHNVIFCEPGYAVYILADPNKDKDNFMFHGVTHRLPPAILVNLNDAYDTEFIHHKAYEIAVEEEEEEEEEEVVTSHIPKNQQVIDFLKMCYNSTNSKYKKISYNNAINEVGSLWAEISEDELENLSIGPSIKKKITEYLMGIPDDDIIHS
jgi:hypothetical protein